jgi:hypothetical protein
MASKHARRSGGMRASTVEQALPAPVERPRPPPVAPGAPQGPQVPVAMGHLELWSLEHLRADLDSVFQGLVPAEGPMKLHKPQVSDVLASLHLPAESCAAIFDLADCDGDGLLDADECVLGVFLGLQLRQGVPLPPRLPVSWCIRLSKITMAPALYLSDSSCTCLVFCSHAYVLQPALIPPSKRVAYSMK